MGFFNATSNQKTILFVALLMCGVMMAYTFKETFVAPFSSFGTTSYLIRSPLYIPPNQGYNRRGF
jgi:hypothetical protein